MRRNNASQPIIVTEGPVKGLAVWQAGGKAISVQGVWNVAEPKPKPKQAKEPSLGGSFDVTEEEETAQAHEPEPEPEPEPSQAVKLRKELQAWSWRSRKVYLAFDSDQLSNPKVRQAVIRSFFLFSIQGAEVYQLEWPAAEAKGIDDYLQKCGIDKAGGISPEKQSDALAGLLGAAKPFYDCLVAADVDLFGRELWNVEMTAARREQFAATGGRKLKTTKAALLSRKDRPDRVEAKGFEIPPTAEPWTEAVAAAEVLDEIQNTIERFVWMKPSQARAVALYIVLGYLSEDVDILPILLVTSPEEECGKTTLLRLLLELANRPIPASNISAAAIFRTIKDICPTLLLDEADTYLKDNEVMRGVLNSGHQREFAFVIRVINEAGDTGQFSTWCPKVIAMIGHPKSTILSRSVHIRLERKSKNQKLEKLKRRHKADFETLRRKIARLANDIRDAVRNAAEVEFSGNRSSDNWRPLFAVARTAGEEWLKETIKAAEVIQFREDKDAASFNQYLLRALEEFIAEGRKKRPDLKPGENFFLRTASIIGTGQSGLNADQEAPWADDPRQLTAQKLSAELRQYGVASDREKGSQIRGYWANELEKVIRQYRK